MKTKINHHKTSAQMLGLCLAALSAFSSLAQTSTGWQTVLNYQLAVGQHSEGQGIAADGSGNVLSAGNGDDASGIVHGITLKTDTTQAIWYLSDDTNPDATHYQSYIWDLGFDTGGNLYSIGQLTPNCSSCPIPQPYWYVRKSPDSGVNWSTVDLYQYAAGQWIDATGFAADNSGYIFVVGWGRDAGTKRNPMGNIHWLVRRSADGGQTWTLVDDMPGPSAAGAGFVPGAGIFVVGVPYGDSTSSWLVRRSVSGEPGTWSTVDSPFAGGAHAVGSDSLGNIYVAGSKWITTATKPKLTGYLAWVTRKSIDGGNNWSTVDTFTCAPNATAQAWGIGRNSAGNVVVVGGASDSGRSHWIVRQSATGDAGSWSTTDDFQLTPGYNATAGNVATDAAGNLLVTGTALDATPGEHWIVRRLANAAP
jgi:hypothetical protein